LVHEAVPDITVEELLELERDFFILRRGIRTNSDLRAVWSALNMLEEMIEEGRVLPEALEEFESKIASVQETIRKTIETIEAATGYVWSVDLAWFIDPETGRLAILKIEDYLY